MLLALSVTVSEPLIVPDEAGWNSTTMLHCAPAAKDEPQLLLWVKLLLAVIPLIVIAVEPVFVKLTVWEALAVFTGWLAKLKLVGDNLSDSEPAMPVPVRLTLWALLLTLSVIDKMPVHVPLAVGVKVTAIEHRAPAPSDEPQVLLSEKPALIAMPVMLMAVLPVFATVID
jgi:hypothetical protein